MLSTRRQSSTKVCAATVTHMSDWDGFWPSTLSVGKDILRWLARFMSGCDVEQLLSDKACCTRAVIWPGMDFRRRRAAVGMGNSHMSSERGDGVFMAVGRGNRRRRFDRRTRLSSDFFWCDPPVILLVRTNLTCKSSCQRGRSAISQLVTGHTCDPEQ